MTANASNATTVDYALPAVRCVCGHNQGRHEVPGFDGECIAEGCRCTKFVAKLPEVSAPTGTPGPLVPPRRATDTVEALVAAARDTGDRRALLVIGRIQSMTAELRHLVAAHRANLAAQAARERDEQYRAALAAMPKPARRKTGEPKAPGRLPHGEYPCTADGCGYVATTAQGRAAHRRSVHEQTEVLCPGCGQRKLRTGLGAHRRHCTGQAAAS